jgi:hypothetical protein
MQAMIISGMVGMGMSSQQGAGYSAAIYGASCEDRIQHNLRLEKHDEDFIRAIGIADLFDGSQAKGRRE